MDKGRVYWITGLSGAGKTTIGTALYRQLKGNMDNVVLLDGDAIRKALGNDLGYSDAERRKVAYRNGGICKILSDQGIHVVCCTISMYDEVRNWNRKNIEEYVEVFLDVSYDVLRQRDQKGLYSGLNQGSSSNVAGMDLQVEFPKEPDLMIDNSGEHSVDSIVKQIIAYRKA